MTATMISEECDALPVNEDGRVTCYALLLALASARLRIAWHAGVIDADTAMRNLDKAVEAIRGVLSSETAPVSADLAYREDAGRP